MHWELVVVVVWYGIFAVLKINDQMEAASFCFFVVAGTHSLVPVGSARICAPFFETEPKSSAGVIPYHIHTNVTSIYHLPAP